MTFFGIKATGVEQVKAKLRYDAVKVPENARKIMHRAADRIVKEAKLNAPIDDGELEKSIHKEVSYEDKGRLTIDIVAGGIVNGVDVDRYALIIHENYEGMTPGKMTMAKRAGNPGRYIGSKFIQRAIDAERPRLLKALISASTVELMS